MAEKIFKDSSTECAICLAPLEEEDTIELTCGHRWHFECLKDQLEHAQPNLSRRLLFSGCRCAKCGVFCDHESLRHLTRRTDALRDKVDTLIREQLEIDAPKTWREAPDRTKLMENGRRNYAFYLCSSCEEPYFGGSIECADQEEGELPSGDRLCPTCAPHSQSICRHQQEHRGFHVWKCRYCCRPSNYVCYGTVHFCHSCHDRNSQRVTNQRRGTTGPPPLEAIPCVGGDQCKYPMQQGSDRHLNGPSPTCEQVYACVMCHSAPDRAASHVESGSRNFIVNPSGELGLQAWQQLGQAPWIVETSEIPVSETVTTNFVSSFAWCIMGQRVPLHRFVNDASSVRIEVSAKFMGRTDCPSVFLLEAIVFDAQRRVLHSISTPELDAPADFWEKTSLVIEPTPGAHEVAICIRGKDRRFWRGNFGAKVAECSLRILCSEENLEHVLRHGEAALLT